MIRGFGRVLAFRGVAKSRKPGIMGLRMQPKDDSYPTSASLLERLKDPADQSSWEEFYTIYGPLIRGFAIKAGLRETEADEVVQETMAAMVRHLPGFHYDPTRCSFKTWLLNVSQWRVIDQVRKRLPLASRPVPSGGSGDDTRTATIDRVPDPAGIELERLWDVEWGAALRQKATERTKAKVEARQWQIFDLYALKGWSASEVARALGINVGRVYIAKHRVGGVLAKELHKLEAAVG